MKFTVVTVKQCTSVNLSRLKNRVQRDTKDLSGIAIVIRKKLQKHFGKQIITLAEIRRKLLTEKAS